MSLLTVVFQISYSGENVICPEMINCFVKKMTSRAVWGCLMPCCCFYKDAKMKPLKWWDWADATKIYLFIKMMGKGNCGEQHLVYTISSFKLSGASVMAWAVSGTAATLMILVLKEPKGWMHIRGAQKPSVCWDSAKCTKTNCRTLHHPWNAAKAAT